MAWREGVASRRVPARELSISAFTSYKEHSGVIPVFTAGARGRELNLTAVFPPIQQAVTPPRARQGKGSPDKVRPPARPSLARAWPGLPGRYSGEQRLSLRSARGRAWLPRGQSRMRTRL